jgi:hypothetical protein
MNPFMKPLSIFGMVGSAGIIAIGAFKSGEGLLGLVLAVLLLPSVYGHFSLQFMKKPAELVIRIALSFNSCWLILHIIRLYSRAGEGHLIDWTLHLPALGVCVANIVIFSVHRVRTVKAARATASTKGRR